MLVQLRRRGAPTRRDRSRNARPRLEPLDDRCLLSGISAFAEYPLPTNTGGSGPKEIAAGPDGNLWFTMSYSPGYIGMINPTTHAITELRLPGGSYEFAWAVTAGPDGNIWFTSYNAYITGRDEIGMINVVTHAITEYTVDSNVGNNHTLEITTGPDGNIWFTDRPSNSVGMISPTTGVITKFALPTAGAIPGGITAGSDGNLWFTESVGRIGEINPTTHSISEFATPTANSAPYTITVGPDGALWFTEAAPSQIGRIDPTTHSIVEFATPTPGAHPMGIAAGPDGNLWFTEALGFQVGEIDPTTDSIAEFPITYGSSGDPQWLTLGPDGNLWFVDLGLNAIGKATLAPTQFVVMQPPPTNLTAGAPFGLTVEDLDSSGSLVSSFDGTVTVSLFNPPGGASLGGTLSVAASNGVATFSGLTLDTAASGYTLLVTSNNVGEIITSAISVTPAAATQIVVVQQPPASVTAGSSFGLSAAVEDAYGNIETGDSGSITVTLATNPGGATLGGTVSLPTSQGFANFGDLNLTRAASGYTLAATRSGLAGATTAAITVTPAAASRVVITQQPPASVKVKTDFSLAVAIEDAYGNVITSATNKVKVAFANNPTGANLGGSASATASQGVATFSGLTISKLGSGYTLQLTSNGLTAAITNAIAVTSSSGAHGLGGIGGCSPRHPWCSTARISGLACRSRNARVGTDGDDD